MIDDRHLELNPVPQLEPSNTEKRLTVLREAISRSKSTELYRRCIDDGLAKKKDNPYQTVQVESTSLKPLIEELFSDELKQRKAKRKATSLFLPKPSDFNYPEETKKATQQTISILFTTRLIDIDLIKRSAKYVGPTNTIFVPGLDADGYFNPTQKYYEFERRTGITYKGKAHFTIPPGERGKYFQLQIGGKYLSNAIERWSVITEKVGRKLNPNEIIKLSFIRTAAHEYGHAIYRSLIARGSNTLEVAHKNGFIHHLEFIEDMSEEIHDEHFAIAISNFVLEMYLRNSLEFSPEQIKEMVQSESQERYYKGESAYALFEYAALRGYSPKELRDLQNTVNVEANEMFGNKISLWNTYDIIYYHTPPYTEEELKTMLSQ